MTQTTPALVDILSAPKLAGILALGDPAFAWDPAQARPLLANLAALKLTGSANLAEFAARGGAPGQAEARQLQQLARQLGETSERIERLRLFARARQITMTCLVSWARVADRQVLVLKSIGPMREARGAPPSAREAAERLFAGSEEVAMVCDAQGQPLLDAAADGALAAGEIAGLCASAAPPGEASPAGANGAGAALALKALRLDVGLEDGPLILISRTGAPAQAGADGAPYHDGHEYVRLHDAATPDEEEAYLHDAGAARAETADAQAAAPVAKDLPGDAPAASTGDEDVPSAPQDGATAAAGDSDNPAPDAEQDDAAPAGDASGLATGHEDPDSETEGAAAVDVDEVGEQFDDGYTFEPTWDVPGLGDSGEGEDTVVFAEPSPDQTATLPRGMIVPFKGSSLTITEDARGLEPSERDAFRAIAEALGARMEEDLESEADAAQEAEGTQLSHLARLASRSGIEALVVGDDALSILDKLHSGLLVFRSGDALFANRAFLDMFEFADFDELAATGDVAALLPQLATEDMPQDAEGAARRDSGEPAPLVARTRHGEAFAVLSRLQAVRWGGDMAMLLSVQRAHGETDRPARRAGKDDGGRPVLDHRLLQAAIELAGDAVVIIGTDGRIVTCNGPAGRLFSDAPGEEPAGRPVEELFAPESREDVRGYVARLQHGEIDDTADKGIAIEGAGGAALQLVIERLVEEPALLAAVLRRSDVATQREGGGEDALQAAEQASSQKSEFMACMSHEIRTPLNSIIGFAELMLRESHGPLNDKYSDYVEAIRDSGAHVLNLINDLLDLSKVEAGKLELNFTRVNLNEVVGQAVKALQPDAGRARVITRSSLAPRLPPIVADHRSLVQICLNLLSNAIKFTPAGGQAVISTAVNERGEVQVRVRDTGVGMSRDQLALAMEPFQQIREAANSNQQGTGLGLPLTRALAEANRAQFRIDSEAGKGTLTEVTFPASRVLAE